ncbi:MAG TPA: hypothetical protein VGN86_05325 [Pyrinomonadaceae bacterium]|jgi:hypothetical protein|nr:hypothetical protein [Pyrinomonadaceae bacterium]
MNKIKWDSVLALGLLVAVVLACSATTANISSLKITNDEAGKNETKSFKPGDKIYAIATISNNGGKVQAKFRVLYDDVAGEKSGTLVQGAEKTLDVEGSRPAVFWITLPPAGFGNGRYKVEVNMLTETGEQKDQKTAMFDVAGYTKEVKAEESPDK